MLLPTRKLPDVMTKFDFLTLKPEKMLHFGCYWHHLLRLGATDVIQVCPSQGWQGLLQGTRVYAK